MAITDPVADMLTRLRNAAKAKFSSVDVPGSKMKVEVARILKDEGFIKNYKFLKDGKQGILRIYLKYGQGQAKTIYSLQRVSKPGRSVGSPAQRTSSSSSDEASGAEDLCARLRPGHESASDHRRGRGWRHRRQNRARRE